MPMWCNGSTIDCGSIGRCSNHFFGTNKGNKMEIAKRNQLANLNNIFQNHNLFKPVLCVCSAGLLRSATMQRVLAEKYGFNTRSSGTEDYALVPISEALILWAKEIVCAEEYHKDRILSSYEILLKDLKNKENILKEIENKITVLDLPDIYSYMDEELVERIIKEYELKGKK